LPELDPLGMVLPDEGAPGGYCLNTAATDAPCSPCTRQASAAVPDPDEVQTPIGRVTVGESGPLALHQIGLPLFAGEAYRFCVFVDGYRAQDEATRKEIARIIEREKPAHTDYRIEYIAPEMSVGFQCRVGIDAIVGGDPPPLRLSAAMLDV